MTEKPEPVAMPALDPNRMLPYSAIRYVPGYPEEYVKEYALSYAEQREKDTFESLVEAATDAAIKYANGYAVDFRAVLLEALAGKDKTNG